MNLEQTQKNISYTFNDIRLLKTALTHRSYLQEKDRDPDITEHNERLEFLGDAVLELVVTEYLFSQIKEAEGMMTALRASLVNYKLIGEVGNHLDLDNLVLISNGEREELGKARLSIVADAMEAIIGAIHLDGGYKKAAEFIERFILIELEEIMKKKLYKDSKTKIQEYSQKYLKITPGYKVIASEGKDHEKLFHVGIWIGSEMMARAEGKSKQQAETEAANKALKILQERFESENKS